MNLFAGISPFLFNLVLHYKYLFLFPITAIEGPLITMAAGFLVTLGVINPFIALPIIVAGDVTSDVFYYFVGRYGERWRLTRWIIRRFTFETHKEKIGPAFEKHGGKILLFGKLTHAFGAVFLIGAGYFDMNLPLFIWYNTIGTIIKSSILMYVGYLAGSAYVSYSRSFEFWSILITIGILIVGFGGIVLWERRSVGRKIWDRFF